MSLGREKMAAFLENKHGFFLAWQMVMVSLDYLILLMVLWTLDDGMFNVFLLLRNMILKLFQPFFLQTDEPLISSEQFSFFKKLLLNPIILLTCCQWI